MIHIGAIGSWNFFHVKEYAALLAPRNDARLVCVSDDQEELARATAEQLDLCARSHEELLADPNIDGVIVVAAPEQAASLIEKAVKAGKAVLADKLIATNGKDAVNVANIIRSGNVPFALDLPFAMKPICLAARQAIDSGRLGRLTGLRIRNAHGGLVNGVLPPHFILDSSSLLTDIGLHGIYMTCLLLGEPDKVMVISSGGSSSHTPSSAVCVMEYGSRLLATVEMGYISPVSPFTMEIYGSEGSFLGGGYDGSARIKRIDDTIWTEMPLIVENEQPITMLEQWLSDMKNTDVEQERIRNLDHGVTIGRMIEAIHESLAYQLLK
ncbi:hypothetical protein GRF59_03105 [Paenibacillus sp. HJL G12]|uniref:Gfo/Idh/MocA family oxidoreductase n=1 Tax=Paenibacillus dendrobii TaxID=2691084 RepID=A0A7X3LFW3_9BACL|nr:Gfo/Idh/MocA family oxidoreductase [Paenibacillus dendrobii]MWV42605.1 hypothetical protein [Paenibacillus dendrobii]